jgi:hypothetical protein
MSPHNNVLEGESINAIRMHEYMQSNKEANGPAVQARRSSFFFNEMRGLDFYNDEMMRNPPARARFPSHPIKTIQ